MKTLLAALGWAFIAFALMSVAVEIDDVAEHKRHQPGMAVAFSVIFGGGGALILRASRRMGKSVEGPRSSIVIRAAQKQAGSITAAEVAADSPLSFEEAKLELDGLAKAGACEVIVGDAGILVYRFPEFESDASKKDVV